MLTRARRLTEKDVERLLKTGRSILAGTLRAKYVPGILPASRFAFVVSKKVARNSVTRNKLRRWCAVAARELQTQSAIDMAVMVTVRYQTLQAVRDDMQALFAKVRI